MRASNLLDTQAPSHWGEHATRGPRYEAARLGFPHYWYPALLSRELGTKPKTVKLLGQNLVFLRAHGSPYALVDRCTHRGMVLSAGSCLAEGTITCPYHGWTFDVTDGRCIAALTDGPESRVVGQRRTQVRTYPVAEQNGIIYVYMGDGHPPPLDVDVPAELLDARGYVSGVVINEWACNWRVAVENGHDAAHVPMVHLNSLRMRTSPGCPPAWYGYVDTFLDGSYFYRRARVVGAGGIYPAIGRWPRYSLLRRALIRLSGRRGGFDASAFRLPSIIRGSFSDYVMLRWVVPIDEQRCRNFMWLVGRQEGAHRLGWLLRYWLWNRWVYTKWFTAQDQFIVERVDYSAPEQLFRPDSSIVGLRKYIEANARLADPLR